MLNKVFLMGRLAHDPELRQTTAGASVCRFSVAVERPYKNQAGEKETDFIDCTAWRQTADFVARYFSKGAMSLIEGAMRNNNYTDNNGVNHYGMLVQVDQVSFCGSKRESDGAFAPQQPQQQTVQPTAAAQPEPQLSLDDLADVEELISDGSAPF